MNIKNKSKINFFLAGDHTFIHELLAPNQNIEINYSLAHAHLEVGTASLPHYLKSSEVYYILSGKGQMFIDESHQIVEKDDVIYIPANAIQYIKNIGEETLNFLCIVQPAWRLEDEVIIE